MLDRENCRCTLGLAETSDMICNLLGAFLDDAALHAAYAVEKHKAAMFDLLD